MNNWIHDKKLVQGEYRNEFLSLYSRQYGKVLKGIAPECACCGKSVEWTKLYRCFQCELWLCRKCCRKHMPEVERNR